jgi:hypothetical protein
MLTLLLLCFVKQKAKLGKGSDVKSGTIPKWRRLKYRKYFLCESNFEKAAIFRSITSGEKLFLLFALVCKFLWCNADITSFSYIVLHKELKFKFLPHTTASLIIKTYKH